MNISYMRAMRTELPIVEREQQIKIIEDSIREKNSLSSKQAIVINIHGQSGMGKTYLNKYFDNKTLDGIVIKYNFNTNSDLNCPEEILCSWAESLCASEKKFKFQLFKLAYNKLQKSKRLNVVFRSRQAFIKEALWDVALATLGGITFPLPFVGSSVGTVAQKVRELELAEKIFTNNKPFVRLLNDIKTDVPGAEQRLRDLAVTAFILDVNSTYKETKKPIIFILDTYEKFATRVGGNNDRWLASIASQINESIWVVRSRMSMDWQGVTLKKSKVSNIKSKDSFMQIFLDSKVEIFNKEHQLYIKRKSDGYPQRLQNCIDQYKIYFDGSSIDLAQITGDTQDIYKRISEGLDSGEKNALYLCAFLERWKERHYHMISKEILGNYNPAGMETLLEKQLIYKLADWYEIEKDLCLCIKGACSNEFRFNLKKSLQNIINNEQDDNLVNYCKSRLDVCIRFDKADDECTKDYLYELYDLLNEDFVRFEAEFFDIWEFPQTISSFREAVMMAMYRNYLKKINNYIQIQETFLDEEQEFEIYEFIKYDEDICFDMVLSYIFAGYSYGPYENMFIEPHRYSTDKDIFRWAYVSMYTAYSYEFELDSSMRHYYNVYMENVKTFDTVDCFKLQLLFIDCLSRFSDDEQEIYNIACEGYEKSKVLFGINDEITREFASNLSLSPLCNRNIAYDLAKELYETDLEIFKSDNYPKVMEHKFAMGVLSVRTGDYLIGIEQMHDVLARHTELGYVKDDVFWLNMYAYAFALLSNGSEDDAFKHFDEIIANKHNCTRKTRGELLSKIAHSMYHFAMKKQQDLEYGRRVLLIIEEAIPYVVAERDYDLLCEDYLILAALQRSLGKSGWKKTVYKLLELVSKRYKENSDEYMRYKKSANNLLNNTKAFTKVENQ